MPTPSPSPWSFHEPPAARYRHYRYEGSTTTPDGLEILSVTQALGVLDKSAPLVGWAVRETLVGVHALLADGLYCLPEEPWQIGADMRDAKLGHKFVLSDAQQRGTATHKVLEDWINEGRIPNPAEHPPAWRGWIRALSGFLATERPTFEESELVVGSLQYGYAGQRDTVAIARDPKRGRCLWDLKTSKGVYPESHFRQLAAYERAGTDCGEQPTDSQGIVRLAEDGSYEIRYLQDLPDPVGSLEFFDGAFLRALAACRDNRAVKVAERKAGK